MAGKSGFWQSMAPEMGAIFVKFNGEHITAIIIFAFTVFCLRYIGNQKLKWAVFAAGFLYGISFLVAGNEVLTLRVLALGIVLLMVSKEYLIPARNKRLANSKKRAKKAQKT